MRSPARSCCGSQSSLAMRSSFQPRLRYTTAFACVTCCTISIPSAGLQRHRNAGLPPLAARWPPLVCLFCNIVSTAAALQLQRARRRSIYRSTTGHSWASTHFEAHVDGRGSRPELSCAANVFQRAGGMVPHVRVRHEYCCPAGCWTQHLVRAAATRGEQLLLLHGSGLPSCEYTVVSAYESH